jgi:hypothetical protein
MAERSPLDRIARGSYTPSTAGSTIFCGLRTLDIFIQHRLLTHGLFSLTPSPSTPLALGLPLPHLLILGMATGSVLKQIYWQLSLSNETFPPDTAVLVSVFNTVCNSANSLLALTAASGLLLPKVLVEPKEGAGGLSPLFIVGALLYAVGILTETSAEVQRKHFKGEERNKGKPYTGGLFSLARHINYGGYTVWRVGYALAAGGIIPGVLAAGVFAGDFAMRAVPLLDEYCSKRVSLLGEEMCGRCADVRCSMGWRGRSLRRRFLISCFRECIEVW